ncbi:MAG: TIGR03118 family protein [Ginsengibacter sp.]
MKKITNGVDALLLKIFVLSSLFIIIMSGCQKHEFPPTLLTGYHQTNLVADVEGYGAARIDPALVNPWGISFSATSPLWISANHSGVSVIYDKDGLTKIPPVTIQNGNGSPTGQVFNGTTGFVIPGTSKPARFIFAGEDGTITAWNGGTAATLVANRSQHGAVYKGLAMGNDGTGNFLYATNFKKGKIDVFDSTFAYVTDKPFHDYSIPSDYGPFNIRLINGNLYVTYAKHLAPDNVDDKKGHGNGYVNIFSTKGQFIKRFASRGALNSPWGIVPSVPGSSPVPDAILIGNFGEGNINVYTNNGDFVGSLKDEWGHDIVIDGLWALENNIHTADPEHLYFTAGPAGETHGLFGYLSKEVK